MHDFNSSVGVMQITIWIGVFPLVITRWLTLGLTIYSVATQMVLYYVRHPNHTEALWFAAVANSLLWWTYIKVSLKFTQSPYSYLCVGG